jgi:lipopolysaccharide/colanic/teichoic acid biosynthesis glycosyltransferase
MKRSEIIQTSAKAIFEIIMVGLIFLWFYHLRFITDGIPFVQLRIPHISYDQFIPFIYSGICIWIIIFAQKWLYSIQHHLSYTEEIRRVLYSGTFWFLYYTSFVYLTTGFLFEKEIPRLIVIYVFIFATFFSICLRFIINNIYSTLSKKWIIKKRKILSIHDPDEEKYHFSDDASNEYIYLTLKQIEEIEQYIREGQIDGIIMISEERRSDRVINILKLARIYGITFYYPKLRSTIHIPKQQELSIGNLPVISLDSVSISMWERIIKRLIDIIGSFIGLILLSPLFLIICLAIKIEDPSGPVIFKNRRIGQNGKIFSLYKFRYMYWKYSVKDAYGVNTEHDEALAYEESLKEKNDTRKGPLYKITNDPRKMRFGKLIEKTSLDELPQLVNVLMWDMSLIGPRPHQPREVELYDEEDRQVLTVKPGITGMAQVYGREKNSFKEEIARDRDYIENYSLSLDIAILFRTIFVIIERIWKSE